MSKLTVKSLFSKEQILENNFIKNDGSTRAKQNKIKPLSAYGKKLFESKKIKSFYGNLSSRYLKNIINKNCKVPSKLNENLFSILERRLDVVLYRAAFFESIASARQMITSKGVKVNENKIVSPSFLVTPGDIISLCDKKVGFNRNRCKLNFQDKEKQKSNFHVKKQASSKKNKASFSLFAIICFFRKITLINLLNTIFALTRVSRSQQFGQQIRVQKKHEKRNIKRLIHLKTRKVDFVNYCNDNTNNTISSFNKNFIVGHENKRQDSLFHLAESPGKLFNKFAELALQAQDFCQKNQYFYCDVIQDFCDNIGICAENEHIEKYCCEQVMCEKQAWLTYSDKYSFFIKHNSIFLKYLLYLKKSLETRNTKKENNKSILDYRKKSLFCLHEKAHNLEICYQNLTIIFLYQPQRICFPFFTDASLIYK